MSNSRDWQELAQARGAVSGIGLRAVGGAVNHPGQGAGHPQQRQSNSERARHSPAAGKGFPQSRWNAENFYASARSVGRAIVGTPLSPGGLKHSASDDMELGGYPLLNGINHGYITAAAVHASL